MSDDQICGVRGTERLVFCTKPGETAAEHLELEALSGPEGVPIKGILTITGGDHHFCAADEDGKLFCWGKNDFGQLGFKSGADYQKPTRVVFKSDTLRKITRVSAGSRFTCVAGADVPSISCFGESLLGGASSPEPYEYPL
jgi:alpha-tubulin suppressor-like RCC1 family protein